MCFERRGVVAAFLISWIVFSAVVAWPITVTKGNQLAQNSLDQDRICGYFDRNGASFTADRFTFGSFIFSRGPILDSIDLDRVGGGKFSLRLETREYGQPATTRTLHRVFIDLNVRHETGVYLDVQLPESSPLRRAIAESIQRDEPHSMPVPAVYLRAMNVGVAVETHARSWFLNYFAHLGILLAMPLLPFFVRCAIHLPGHVLAASRLRRGLCPKCAYPMGESSVCSECGRELPQRVTTA